MLAAWHDRAQVPCLHARDRSRHPQGQLGRTAAASPDPFPSPSIHLTARSPRGRRDGGGEASIHSSSSPELPSPKLKVTMDGQAARTERVPWVPGEQIRLLPGRIWRPLVPGP